MTTRDELELAVCKAITRSDVDTSALMTMSLSFDIADALIPFVERAKAKVLREMADAIDEGPTFALPPSIVSTLIRERADEIEKGIDR